MKNISKSVKKVKYKIKGNKINQSNLYDEIEINDIKIKETKKKLKDLKTNSLKQFVYSNKRIPDNWKNKLDYQNQVLEMFAEDRDFLLYVGNNGDYENNEQVKKRPKTAKTKFTSRNNEQLISLRLKTGDNILKNENSKENSLLFSKNNSSSINIKKRTKYNLHRLLGNKEINNIFNELNVKYPIKDKLLEIFPVDVLNSIKAKNKLIEDKNSKNKNIYYDFKQEKRRNIFRQNIFVNLIPPKSSNKSIILPRRTQNSFMKDEYKKQNKRYSHLDNQFERKKHDINNENVMYQLESINFFGPYYSYCPPCGNRNVDFYQNLDSETIIQIVKQIKKNKRAKNLERFKLKAKH